MTLEDVGRAAGVSRATASLVLRGEGRVSADTAARVRAAMDQLGYVYNRHAASMREERTLLLGLIATDITNPFFGEVTMSIERVARAAGFTVLAGYSGDDVRQQSELLRTMAQHRVDAIMIQPALGTDTGAISAMSGSPIVQFVRHVSDEVDFVGLDDARGGDLVGRHLLEIGVRSVVYLGGSDESTARRERIEGLRAALAGSDVDFRTHDEVAANNLDGGARAVSAMYDAGLFPDAVVAHSDAVAFGAYMEMRRRGVAPGADVAVVSFDDLPLAVAQYPALTSVGIDKGKLGGTIAETTLTRISEPAAAARSIRLAPAIRIRASTTSWRPRR